MSDREEAATGAADLAEEMGRATERLRAQAWKISQTPAAEGDEAAADATTAVGATPAP